MSAASNLKKLQDRAHFFQKVRLFFANRNVLEVDTPILSKTAPIDEHIDIMSVSLGEKEEGYLHSSPEYAMKRLLSMGSGDIFQMSHVFRQKEVGALHNPEFTMVEWYRVGMDFFSFIQETVEFIQLFLGPIPDEEISYKEAFLRFAHLNPMKATEEELWESAKSHGLDLSGGIEKEIDTLLHLLMGFVIEPHLGKEHLTVLLDYPASQAALAVIEEKDGEKVAKRFEVYYKGIELANGYLELTDAQKQEQRFHEANHKRIQKGKKALPIDHHFIQALAAGMPPCCGVAVGFDRLLLLHNQAHHLQQVLPFSWEEI